MCLGADLEFAKKSSTFGKSVLNELDFKNYWMKFMLHKVMSAFGRTELTLWPSCIRLIERTDFKQIIQVKIRSATVYTWCNLFL